MALALNDEQRFLKQTAAEFFAQQAPIAQLRQLRDQHSADGFDRATWQQMVELGWSGILIPERFGGSDFGFLGLALVLEESGRTLAATPLLATALIGASALLLGGSAAQQQAHLPAIAAGQRLSALAIEEQGRHAPYQIACRVERQGSGFVLDGSKQFVIDGHVADLLIVSARSRGQPGERDGITLLLVPADAPGVTITRNQMVDSRNAASIRFDRVKLEADALLGQEGEGAALLDALLDRARIGLAAEMLGSLQECFERTIGYLKERQQFGVAIGSFQALKHRAAQMFCEVELCKSVVLQAASSIDDAPDQSALLASLAKARLCDTATLVSNEGIQMHGGIGMTDEFDIGFFIKRARVAAHAFGDANYHRDRYATLDGY
ncbi:MAG TPA: acyl-CoA dehydrogenase family protein [Pseudomonadales bacterium]|jgi:alkylation response protein AidB-like acyl-CoA dehydrogenase|nr:acyl-CoA dehydrogenase family protein [Pseudomonadales bacterium]HMW83543.1 acyl-CoA dehydrogenase family protein [Pseudomonadales bacterium]HMZ70058.1 acyl-CoA dehydrogenase family protein [Pseudomonadales bacterium]HMZ91187.1 acyl-CoA dehydrogenase family protein [Pseudomonadales bacterium]HNB83399.1 acyl-CoA dehydrogenase family protein [Pseudomonadales bacterium]